MYGLPIRAEDKLFDTISEHTLDSSPTVSNSLKLWSSKHGVETLYDSYVSLFRSPTSFNAPLSHVLLCHVHNTLVRLAFMLSTSQIHMVKK